MIKKHTTNNSDRKPESVNVDASVMTNVKRVTGGALALANPSGYLSVSDRGKRFRIEVTTFWKKRGRRGWYPEFYDFEEAELVHDMRNWCNVGIPDWSSNEDWYDPGLAREIYGKRKDADAIFNAIIREASDRKQAGNRRANAERICGCCLIGRTSDGLEAVEREWIADEEFGSYNMIRLQTDIHELVGRFGATSLDDLMKRYGGQLIRLKFELIDCGETTVSGLLELFKRRKVYSVKELRQAAARAKKA